MFQHQHHLRHLLRPHHYTDAGWYRTELERLFRPTWHLVGTKHDLPRAGDFRPLELCGETVLLLNAGDRLAAFRDVYPRPDGRGRSGVPWVYYQFLGRRPAGASRVRGGPTAGLARLRSVNVGELVFVSLTDGGESVREFFGPIYPVWESGFDGADFRLAGHWDCEFDCNWKVAVEKALEPLRAAPFPLAADGTCESDPDDRYTAVAAPATRRSASGVQTWCARRLGLPVTGVFTHQTVHPHVTFSGHDAHRTVMAVYPLGPERCRVRQWVYAARGRRTGPLAWAVARLLGAAVCRAGRREFREAGRYFPAVQAGLRASPHPGVLGDREERIYVFQRYVLGRCDGHARNGASPRGLFGEGGGDDH